MAAARLDILSQPKAFADGYAEDRRSVYWIDSYPPKAGSDGVTVFAVTPRLDELSKSRTYTSYEGNRLTAVWPVTMGAKNAESSPRVSGLAEPKPLHQDYHQGRSAHSEVTPGAKSAEATARLAQLSEPKPHKVWGSNADVEYRNMHYATPISEVLPQALQAVCSPRVETLATAKALPTSYQREKPVQWIVTDTAKNASASTRVQQLSRPKTNASGRDDYNPYCVTTAAQSAHASTRVAELSAPLARKVRQKLVL